MNDIKIDFITNTIYISKKFFSASTNPASEEYTILNRLKTENPFMHIAIKSRKKYSSKNSNKGLSYKYMRKFISVMDEKNMSSFDNTLLYYESFGYDNKTVYKYVREWFLKNYPNHKEMIVNCEPKTIQPLNNTCKPSKTLADIA